MSSLRQSGPASGAPEVGLDLGRLGNESHESFVFWDKFGGSFLGYILTVGFNGILLGYYWDIDYV